MIARICLLAALLGGAAAVLPAQEAPPPVRAIVNVTGQLYRAQNDRHFTVFLVTPAGIIMSDPINRDFATWLKGELASRFKVPVRYVLYTHHDWDHASGGAVFADTAEFIAHEQFPVALALPSGRTPLAAADRNMDANSSGLIERSEATGEVKDTFDLHDENGDAVLSGAELARGALNDVYPPSSTFSDRHTVTLSGKRAEIIHVGPAHTSDSAVVYFPDERAVFSADVLQVKRFPGNIVPTVGAWVDAYKTIMALDFQHTLTGHGLAGNRQDAADMLRFFEDLSTGVAAGIGSGRSLPEIQETLTLDAFKGFERWDTHRQTHIATVYATIKGTK